jgi:hypothetical protein
MSREKERVSDDNNVKSIQSLKPRERVSKDFTVHESTEKGDIAKSLQALVNTQFVSKNFKDIFGATRLTKAEVYIFAMMNMNRVMSKILSIDSVDVSEEALRNVSESEKTDLLELWELKKRYYKNPFAFSYTIYDAFMSMAGLGLQSLDGLSRTEGTQLVGGTYQKILDPKEMGFLDKAKRRLLGNVIYPAGDNES